MKKVIIPVIATILVLAFMTQMGWLEIVGIHRVQLGKQEATGSAEAGYDSYTEDGLSYRVKCDGDYFYLYQDGNWNKVFWKGVNIGAGEPGLFPGDLNISYEDYYRWFGYISKMNCNCIRVYTTLMPQFYTALYDFNSQSDNPLYLFQGVWMDEDDMAALNDVYADNNKIMDEFQADALDMVDIIHGNKTLAAKTGFASGTYTSDVSQWFAGWILGMEIDANFILNTNNTNPDKDTYEGSYLYTQGSTPFEAFYCTVGDAVIKYETETYKTQHPLAFTNWVTTDPLTHDAEPHPDEDKTTLNTESIKSRDAYKPGMFASYHVYPYYPDCMNYQADYINYIDDEGKINPYRAYLADLKLAHTMPIIIAEFGIPTSRGMGHTSIMGYNQGDVDETDQGTMVADMFNSIYQEKYAGGIVFAWQDERFKRTWNNVKFDDSERRPYWSNAQTCEQAFGILTFDPGSSTCSCYVDGDVSDWASDSPIATTDQGSLYMKCDEKYVYFMVDTADGYDFDNDTLLIPIDTIDGQGNTKMSDTGATFDSAADFVIEVNGQNNTRILCDSYYDAFDYLYGTQYKMVTVPDDITTKDSGRFDKMMMCYGYEMTIPTTSEVVPFKSFETGLLKYGDANPSNDDYKSLSDFCYKDGKLEIKIPWQLLNVMDPSSKEIMDDFYTQQSITTLSFDSFKAGLGLMKSGTTNAGAISLSGTFTYSGWTTPTYHERLKPSYEVLQKALAKLS